MQRFIAHIARSAEPSPRIIQRACEVARIPSHTIHLRVDDRLSIGVVGEPPLAFTGGGMIVGTAYRRDGTKPVTRIEKEEAAAIIGQGATRMVRDFWGPFVAFLPVGTVGIAVLRAPLGALPCYVMEIPDGWIVASDLELAKGAGLLHPAIAWDTLRTMLAAPDLRRTETCIEGFEELPGGFKLEIRSGDARREMIWSPWAFAKPPMHILDKDAAAARVAAAVRTCTAAAAHVHDKAILLLSGGLDSSIVAAALHDARSDFEALNLVTRDASGDERGHARRVAEHLDIAIHEAVRQVDRITIACSQARRLPRPTTRLFTQETTRIATELARQVGASAVFNGGGGDNVFCALQSSGPAADRLRISGPGRAFIGTAMEISRVAPAPLTAVMADAVRRAWLGKRALTPTRDFWLMREEACEGIPLEDHHPWLVLPKDALPGTAAQVRLIAIAQNYVEGLDPQDALPTIAPLLSQPVVEACLQIPTWLWFERGLNRAIARHAFVDALPAETVRRRSKGTPDSFAAEIFVRHRSAIRELLADGLLVTHGIIDRDALLCLLDDTRPARPEAFHRVERFVDFEAWAQTSRG